MDECIEREAAIKAIYESDPNGIRRTLGFNVGQIEEALRAVPAVDLAPVVRCRDCKHSYEDIGGLCCSYGPMVDSAVPKTFFCALGERKTP